MSTPKPNRASVFVELDNYAAMGDDPIFWRALRNNLWFALLYHPVCRSWRWRWRSGSMVKIAGRSFLRMAYFTPPCCQ